MQDKLLTIEGREENKILEVQLKTMIEQIRDIRTGVFSPFAQQPLVRAVLGLVSGASGLAHWSMPASPISDVAGPGEGWCRPGVEFMLKTVPSRG